MYSRYYLFTADVDQDPLNAMTHFLRSCDEEEMSTCRISISDDVTITVYFTNFNNPTHDLMKKCIFAQGGSALVHTNVDMSLETIVRHMQSYNRVDNMEMSKTTEQIKTSPPKVYNFHFYHKSRSTPKRDLQYFLDKHESKNRCMRVLPDGNVTIIFSHMRLNIRGAFKTKYVEHLGYNILGEVLIFHDTYITPEELEDILKVNAKQQTAQMKELPCETRYRVKLVDNHISKFDSRILKTIKRKNPELDTPDTVDVSLAAKRAKGDFNSSD